MSSSNALTPRPAATARPIAAGTSTPSGVGTAAVTESRVGSHTRRNETRVSTHMRVAHTIRGPVGSTSGTNAMTTSPGVYQPERAGPESNRSASPNVNGARTRRACVAGSAPSIDQIQGDTNTTLTAAPSNASAPARKGAQSPSANNVDSANATATRTGNRIAGGQAAAAIAPNNPTATTACSAPRRPRSLSAVARITACSTNGASAKSTSGPTSPRPIASRPTGLA